MPVEKFKDFDSARRALWLNSGDPRFLERFKKVCALSRALAPSVIAMVGVRKYRSLEEAEADRKSMRAKTQQPTLSEEPPRNADCPASES